MKTHEDFLPECWSSCGILAACSETESCGSSGASGNRFPAACVPMVELMLDNRWDALNLRTCSSLCDVEGCFSVCESDDLREVAGDDEAAAADSKSITE